MDFDVLSCTVRRTQGLCQVFGNQIAGNGNNRGMADCAIGINRDVGCTATDIDNAHAQIFFVFSQNGVTACQRLKHDLIHLQAAALDTFLDILQSSVRTGNDVYTGIQTHAAHADRLFHTGLVVDDVLLNHGMQDIVIRRNIDGFGRFDGTIDVGLRYFAIFNFDHAL